ncbi:MAG: hypothetical protein WC789_04625 [Lentisphaeria bacterium]|jgi:hypothetical protein
MQKLCAFTVQDLILEPKTVAARLAQACRAPTPSRVAAVCQLDRQVWFILQPVPASATPEEYVLAPVKDPSTDGFPAELLDRWVNRFLVRGTVALDGHTFLALYARELPG